MVAFILTYKLELLLDVQVFWEGKELYSGLVLHQLDVQLVYLFLAYLPVHFITSFLDEFLQSLEFIPLTFLRDLWKKCRFVHRAPI